jgi:hypothetical protein
VEAEELALPAQCRSLEFSPSTRLRAGDGGSWGRSEPSNGLMPFRRPLAGVGGRSKADSEALRTAARAWATDKADRGRAGNAHSRGAGRRLLLTRFAGGFD